MNSENVITGRPGEIFPGHTIPILNAGEIHVWCSSGHASLLLTEQFHKALTASERERISYFKFQQHRDEYIRSQGLLRLLLSSYLEALPEEIVIGRHRKGKPYLLNDGNLYFNISNSGDCCILAFSRDGEVGIDVEKIRLLEDINDLIKCNFTPKEQAYINQGSADRTRRFFEFWTVKEAYLKAIGEGMRLPPNNLEFSVENGVFKLDAVNGVFDQEDWLFKRLALGENYAGTIAYAGLPTRIIELEFA